MTTGLKFFLSGLILLSIQIFAFETSFAQAKKRKPAPKKPVAAKKVAAAKLPKVTQIDLIALQKLLRRGEGESTKPLLINFWATWCDPCREEFPDLVKIDADYKGKIDFVTVSLDDLAEINREVPKFLRSMKAKMPAYLLKTADEEAAITAISEDWQGALPFTVLYDPKGVKVFTKQGKIKPDALRTELDKLSPGSAGAPAQLKISDLPLSSNTKYTFEKGRTEARKDIADGKLIIKRYGMTMAIPPAELKGLRRKYGVEIVEHGCLITNGFIEYVNAYNEAVGAEISRKFGRRAFTNLTKKYL